MSDLVLEAVEESRTFGEDREDRVVIMTFITRVGEGLEDAKIEKLLEAKPRTLSTVLIARSCARVGKKDVVGKIKSAYLMGVRVAGRGGRNRGDRMSGQKGRGNIFRWALLH